MHTFSHYILTKYYILERTITFILMNSKLVLDFTPEEMYHRE